MYVNFDFEETENSITLNPKSWVEIAAAKSHKAAVISALAKQHPDFHQDTRLPLTAFVCETDPTRGRNHIVTRVHIQWRERLSLIVP